MPHAYPSLLSCYSGAWVAKKPFLSELKSPDENFSLLSEGYTMTTKQIAANRANAKLSTGPRSIEGKQAVSGNRITHGILSTKLLLADESAEEYQALQDGLQTQLRPVGALELSLVERIAVSLWRQQRLVKAEAAFITINKTPRPIADLVCDGMGIGKYSDKAIKPKDLEPPDQEQIEWCNAIIAECEGVLNLNQLQKKAPLLFAQLTKDAEDCDLSEYLEEEGGLDDYVSALVTWCKEELEKAGRYEQISQLAGTAADQLRIPWGKLDTLTKYQTALDNQTYKAMKALRETQEWRLKTIEEPVVGSKAA